MWDAGNLFTCRSSDIGCHGLRLVDDLPQIQLADPLPPIEAGIIALDSAFDYNISFALVATVADPGKRAAFAFATPRERPGGGPMFNMG